MFTSERAGGYVNPTYFSSSYWPRLLGKAGVPYRKFHTLRHTTASRLIAAGAPVTEVAHYLGDTVAVVTKVYAHWMRPTTTAADVLDADFLRRQGGGKVADAPLSSRKRL